MAYTTDDINLRFDTAAGEAADEIELGADPYIVAAYGGPDKAAFNEYAVRVGAVISTEPRLIGIINQGAGRRTRLRAFSRLWLDQNDTYWVHCFSNNMPNPTPYRVYVCAKLSQTHNVLRQLLQNYNRPLYFKVASHSEAQVRNDTIVSWHQTLDDAHAWASIARANATMLEGTAPAGTFGGIDTYSVGIDTEVAGDTSTSRIARAGEQEAMRRRERAIRSNPYI